jgi:cell wall-associated NlpC family hydrolase
MIFLTKEVARKQKILLETAEKCLGKQYVYGAKPEEAPAQFDCSSLVQYLYKKMGVEIPRSSIEQAHIGRKVRFQGKESALRVGDLLFFKGTTGHYNPEFPGGIGHVAMYLGEGRCVQASGSVGKVVSTSLEEVVKRGDLVVVKRVG